MARNAAEELARKQAELLKELKDSLIIGNQDVIIIETAYFRNVDEAIHLFTSIDKNLDYHHNQAINYAILAGKALIKYKELCEKEDKDYINFLNENGITWGRSYIDSLIRLYYLGKHYPKLRKLSKSIHFVFKNFSKIRSAITSSDEERNFWKTL